MLRFKCLIWSLLLCAPFLQAVELRKSIDYAVFYGGAEPIVELYYSIYSSDLTFELEGGDYKAYYLGQLTVQQNDSIIKSFAWKNVQSIAKPIDLQETDLLVDQITLSLPAGNYVGMFTLQDLNSGASPDTTLFDVKVPAPQEDAYFSDIEFASSIRRAQENEKDSRFYKNTLIVEPNPSLLYSSEMPALFFYVELYNVDRLAGQKSYTFTYSVVDKNGKQVPKVEPKNITRQNATSAMVEFGYLNVGELQAGGYQLKLELHVDEQIVAEKMRDFYVYQTSPRVAVAPNDYGSSIFAAMDSIQINNEFAYVFYIVPKEEKDVFKEISGLEERRHYLFDFWNKTRPDVDATQNEMRLEYLRRVKYANQNYRAFKREGWRTDRGRVYILYGEPNEIDRYPNEPNMVPYIIWNYHNMQNGVRFIFAEVEGYNDFQLIHSDLYGEIQNPDYKQILRSGIF